MTLLNLDTVLRQLERYREGAIDGLRAGLYQEGERIMAESKQLVPVDTGTLRSTGHVELPEVSGGKISVSLVYGGPAAKYAYIVHERLDLRHAVGQAKYLEQPVQQAIPSAPERIGRVAVRHAQRRSGVR